MFPSLLDILSLRIRSNKLYKKLLSGGSWAFAGRSLTSMLSFALSALLARLLAPEAMGAYFLVFSLVTVATSVAQLGLNQTVVRLVAQSLSIGSTGRARTSINRVFAYGLISSIFIALCLFTGLWDWLAKTVFESTLLLDVTGLASIWIIVFTVKNLIAETYRGFQDIRFATLFGGALSSLLSVVFLGSLFFFKGYSNLNEVVFLTIVSLGISVVIGGSELYRRIDSLEKDSSPQDLRILSICLPIFISNISFLLLTKTDILLLGIFCSQEEVAIYGAVARLSTMVAIPLLILNSVVSPIIAELFPKGEKKDLENTIRSVATIAGLPAILIAIVIFIFSDKILNIIYGGFYSSGSILLNILTLGYLVNVLSGSCGLCLIMTGQEKLQMVISVIFGIITIFMSLLLVRNYGSVGIAIAFTLGLVCQNIAMLIGTKVRVGIWTHIYVGRIFLLKSLKKINL